MGATGSVGDSPPNRRNITVPQGFTGPRGPVEDVNELIDSLNDEEEDEESEEEDRGRYNLRINQSSDEVIIDINDTKCENDGENGCVICYENKRIYCFVPCGHHIVCGGCAKSIHESTNRICPLCRKKYTNIIKIFQ